MTSPHTDRPPDLLQPFLEAARRGPSPEEVRAVAARLAPLSTRTHAGRIAAVCIAVAMSGASAWWSFRPDRDVVPPTAVAQRASGPPVSAPEPGVAAATPAPTDAARPQRPHPADAPRPRAPLRRRMPEAPAQPSAVLPAPEQRTPSAPASQDIAAGDETEALSEIDLLQRAQAALATDPAGAFALALVHQRRFPQGILAQEREVIAVDALARLGRIDAARVRADRFHARWPGSAHRKRLEAVITR